MRLVCPNCDAEYEVDSNLVPAEGRDVQCSNCSITWFQKHAQDEEAQDAPPAAAKAVLTPQRPETDPKALKIIHEEVERETRARKSEGSTLETQTDLGLNEGNLPDAEPEPQIVEAAVAPAPQRSETAKKELFPDIEEINSTLADAPDPTHDEDHAAEHEAAPDHRSGFRMGFGLMLMLTAALLALYVYAPVLSEKFPGLTDILTGYVAAIDSLRTMLDTGAQGLLAIVTDLTEQVGK